MDARADGRGGEPGWEELSRVVVDVVRTAVAGSQDALTPVQLRCLEVLADGAGRRVGDLADELGVVASSASRLVDRLVALGLVGRRQATASRREVDVRLTPAGRRALARTASAVEEALAAATAPMTSEDQDALRRGLAALAQATDEAARPASAGRPGPEVDR
ncbi:MarR family transcriptional regulator [Pseudokineococcus basanitobsidens]|uniref:MarR family transcriptional regulator n=1 Tax=Pseudokineococcus basanitobsidens TaxID=1926649 RepID=A0ABU8RHW9_9ACTN